MKDISGYEGLYAITEHGEVWSYKRKKFLSPGVQPNGYLRVVLLKGHNRKNYSIHRLVAEAFIPNPNDWPIVNHKDENKANNDISNLEWCTYSFNNSYGQSHIARVQMHAKAISKAVYCIELERTFESAKEASKILGITHSNIVHCLKGRHKTAGGYHWKYCAE